MCSPQQLEGEQRIRLGEREEEEERYTLYGEVKDSGGGGGNGTGAW